METDGQGQPQLQQEYNGVGEWKKKRETRQEIEERYLPSNHIQTHFTSPLVCTGSGDMSYTSACRQVETLTRSMDEHVGALRRESSTTMANWPLLVASAGHGHWPAGVSQDSLHR